MWLPEVTPVDGSPERWSVIPAPGEDALQDVFLRAREYTQADGRQAG